MSEAAAFRLHGSVQHYAWGGYEFIPGLLGIGNPERKPFAELWIGAHPKAPSTAIVEGRAVPLNSLAPEGLPYLLKVLDARQPLSIQVHPGREQARQGFARENRAGIPSEADTRNYRDANHKPEVHVALGDFRMLHGFRPWQEIRAILASVPELGAIPLDLGLPELYRAVMTMPQDQVDALLDPLLARLARENPQDKDTPDYWALRAAEALPLAGGHRDRGIVSLYLLNLVHLRQGQGTFQPAGVPHAYLEGVTVELMANSDNVLRGGLTSKHVDAGELLRTLSFDCGAPAVLDGEPVSPTETVYRTPAEEFELSRLEVRTGTPHCDASAHGPDSIIVLEGSATLACAGRALALGRGEIAFVRRGFDYTIGGTAVLFKASVPVSGPRDILAGNQSGVQGPET